MLETAVTTIISIITSFIISYITLLRKSDKLEQKIEFINTRLDKIESLKLEEILAKLESKLDILESVIIELKEELKFNRRHN